MSCPQDLFSEFSDVRDLVNHTLCNHEELEPDAFPLTEKVLERAGQPIGVFFCLHGPRSVRYTAIWETDRNVVLFYGSTGERFRTVQLGAKKSAPRRAKI